jgi:hypothetical protein
MSSPKSGYRRRPSMLFARSGTHSNHTYSLVCLYPLNYTAVNLDALQQCLLSSYQVSSHCSPDDYI